MIYKKIKPLFLFLVFLTISNSLLSQLTISNGKHNLEITGAVSTYFNYRFYKDSLNGVPVNNYKKNRYKLRDAQIQLEGRIGNDYEYELQFDLANINGNLSDPENPGLMDAYFMYKGLNWFDITIGYSKLPYSRTSLTPFIYSTYWKRPLISSGEFFSRRDIGLTINKSLWKQRVNMYAGMYNGLGEQSILGENDASGNFEYVGRIDFAYPTRYRYREIDDKISPIPMFAVGFNGRYTNKIMPQGKSFPTYSTGKFGLKLIDGEKYTYGLDLAGQYKGVSFLVEIHQMKSQLSDSNSYLLNGLPYSHTKGFVKSGGYLCQVNYYLKKQKTILGARFEEMNISDLSKGTSKRLSGTIAYQVNGFNSMIKLQFFKILSEEEYIDPLNWTEQVRVGWQFLFK